MSILYLRDATGNIVPATTIQGAPGDNGTTFTPSVSDGVLSWSNDGGLENPPDFDFGAIIPNGGGNEFTLLDTFDLSTGAVSYELNGLDVKEVIVCTDAETLETPGVVKINGIYCSYNATSSLKFDYAYFRAVWVDGKVFTIFPRNSSGGENIALERCFTVGGTAINTITFEMAQANAIGNIFVYAR